MNIMAERILREQRLNEMQQLFGENFEAIRQLYKSIIAIGQMQQEVAGLMTNTGRFVHPNQEDLIKHRVSSDDRIGIDLFDILDKTDDEIVALLSEMLNAKQQQLHDLTGDKYDTFIEKETEYRIHRKAGRSKFIVLRSRKDLPADFNVLKALAAQPQTSEFSELRRDDCLSIDFTGVMDFDFEQCMANPEAKSALLIRIGYGPAKNDGTQVNTSFLRYASRGIDFVKRLFAQCDNLPYDYIAIYGPTAEISVFLANEVFEVDSVGAIRHIRTLKTRYMFKEAMTLVVMGKTMCRGSGYANLRTVYKDDTDNLIYLISGGVIEPYTSTAEDIASNNWIIFTEEKNESK